MKIFIIACVALAACIGFVFIGQAFIQDSLLYINDMISPLPETLEIAEKTPEDILGRLDSATNDWTGKHFKLCIFISHKEFDEVENLLINLRAAVVSGDIGNYAANISMLRERLTKLSESERISANGII